MEDLRCKKCNEQLISKSDADEHEKSWDLSFICRADGINLMICAKCTTSYFPCNICTKFTPKNPADYENRDYESDDKDFINFDSFKEIKKVSNLTFMQIVCIPDDENEIIKKYHPDIIHYDVKYKYDEFSDRYFRQMKNTSSILELSKLIKKACKNSNCGMYDITSLNLCEWNLQIDGCYNRDSVRNEENYYLTGCDGGQNFILHCKTCNNYVLADDGI
jgi:hypothetical protein